ncbi:MAG: hypothetical protein ACYC6W_11730 [Nitrosotalea sp.]
MPDGNPVDQNTSSNVVAATATINANITYIQRDISNINQSLVLMNSNQQKQIDEINAKIDNNSNKANSRIDNLSRIVFIGVGASMTLSILLPFILNSHLK